MENNDLAKKLDENFARKKNWLELTELGKEYEIYNKLFTDEERLYCVQLLEEEYKFDFKKKSRKDLLLK